MRNERGRAERVAELFDRALSLGGEDRGTFLESLHVEDPEIAVELESLLAARDTAPEDLEILAARLVPEVLGNISRSIAGEALEPQQTLGHYHILDRLGSGGMAEVYRARDLSLDRLVVLKFLPAHLTEDAEARARLTREARAASALDHPNIAVVFEIGTTEPAQDSHAVSRLFIAMAYYDGETIKQKIARGPLPIAQAVDYAVQAADGLAAAHEAGIVHRDIKPANLIVTERQQLKILDFGIAKLAGHDVTTEGSTLGTIAYMSPEQTRGAPVDARTDLWSLGVVLNEMFAGVRPFPADDGALLLQAIRHDRPVPLREVRSDVPEALERVVERCLCKDPDLRYADAGELRADLAAVATAGPTGAVPAARGSRRWVAVGLAVLALGAAAFWLLPRTSETPSPLKSRVLVLPLASVSGDTLLERVGRELAVTLGTALDGIGDLRTVDVTTALAQLPGPDVRLTVAEARALARRLGAGSVVVGSVIGDHRNVRADVRLVAPGDTASVVGAAARAAPDSLAALTDSLAVGLVRQLWREGEAPVPSLAAVTTYSAEALRRYVEGEQAMSRGDMVRAVEAFEAAFAIDSTFWTAYWRSLYPRAYEGTPAADSAARAAVIEHRDELPEPDRRMIEAGLDGSLPKRMEGLTRLLDDFRDAWPAAYDLANMYIHFAPHQGHTLAESRAAIEHVIALNPNFVPAWTHLLMIAPQQGDTARTREAIEALASRVDETGDYWRPRMAMNRAALTAMVRGGDLRPAYLDEMVLLFQWEAERHPVFEPLRAGHFHVYGYPALQLRFNDRTLETVPGLTGPARATLHMANAHIWATRGAWDSASVALERWLALTDDPETPLNAYGLGIAAALVEAWDDERIDGLRRGAAALAAAGESRHRAEVAWLDGVLAFSRRDTASLANARQSVRSSAAWKAEELDRSLAAFETALAGEEEQAAHALHDLELEAADRYLGHGYAGSYRYASVIHRFLAVPWLLAAGDSAAARRLVHWYEGVPPNLYVARVAYGTFLLVPYVRLHQGRLDAARGRVDEASRHFRAILDVVDRPSTPRAQRLRDEAAAALVALRREDR